MKGWLLGTKICIYTSISNLKFKEDKLIIFCQVRVENNSSLCYGEEGHLLLSSVKPPQGRGENTFLRPKQDPR